MTTIFLKAALADSENVETIVIDGLGTYKVLNIEDNGPYDDLQIDISSVKLPPANTPTWRDYDYGISSGVEFPTLGFALNEYIYFTIQTKHEMKLNTVLDQHIHFMTPTDGTGDNFKFQLDCIAAGVGGAWAVPTGSPYTSEIAMTADLSNTHTVGDIADIAASNTTVSTLYKCKLTRIAASADEYSGEIYIDFADCHYQKDSIGSTTEYTK